MPLSNSTPETAILSWSFPWVSLACLTPLLGSVLYLFRSLMNAVLHGTSIYILSPHVYCL